MNYNRFAFLMNEWPNYFSFITKIEENLATNPDISLIHGRDLATAILTDVVNTQQLHHHSADFKELLNLAFEHHIISTHIKLKFELIHESWQHSLKSDYDDYAEAAKLYEHLFEIMCWYISQFGTLHHTTYTQHLLLGDRAIMLEYLLEAALKMKQHTQSSIQPLPEAPSVQQKTYSEDEINQLKKLVQQGDKDAAYELALIYLTVYEEMNDDSFYEMAIDLFKKACYQRHLPSLVQMTKYLDVDDMDELLLKININELKSQAIVNNSDAQYLLGWIYKDGLYSDDEDDAIDIDIDTDLAIKWMKKANQNGHALATEQLAYLYFENEQLEDAYNLLKSILRSKSPQFVDQFHFTYSILSFYFKVYDVGMKYCETTFIGSLPPVIIEVFMLDSMKLYKQAKSDNEKNIALHLMNQVCIHDWKKTEEICKEMLHFYKTEEEKVAFIKAFTQALEFYKFQNITYKSTIPKNLGKLICEHSSYTALIEEGMNLIKNAVTLGSPNFETENYFGKFLKFHN